MRPRKSTSIYKRKGRPGYTLEYQDPESGKPVQKQFRTKAGAQELERTVIDAAKAAAGMADDRLFAEYSAGWLTATETAVREGTAIGYEWALRVHLVPAFGTHYLREITPGAVKALIVEKRAKLSRSTTANIKAVLHACLEHAVEDGILTRNPAHYKGRSLLLKLTPNRAEKRLRKVKAMDAEQVRAFFDACPVVAPEYHALFYALFAAGLRIGEGLALQPGDVDYNARRITVQRSLTPRGKLEPPKAGEDGEVDMSPRLAALLRSVDTSRDKSSAWMFHDDRGDPLSRWGVERSFRRVVKAAGLPQHFTPHCMRHTCATQLLVQGESIYYVQRLLRHADITMTIGTYGSWLPAGNPEAVARMEQRLLGRSDESQKQEPS